MPRGRGKKSQSPKVKVEKSSSQIPEVAIELQSEKSPRRSSRCSTRSQVSPGSEPISEGRRSRRSSTAAQTAASEAHARVTRSRSHKESPTSTPKSEAESPATRVRSGCRNKSRVNYQEESEGEEDTTTVKKGNNDKDYNESNTEEKLARSGNKRATSRSPKKQKRNSGDNQSVQHSKKRAHKNHEEPENDSVLEDNSVSQSDEEMEKDKNTSKECKPDSEMDDGEKPSKECKPDSEIDDSEKPSKECKPDSEIDDGEKPSKECKPDSEMDDGEKPSKEGKPDSEMDGGEKPSKECKPDSEMDGGEKPSKECKPYSEMDDGEKPSKECKPDSEMDGGEKPSKECKPDSKMDGGEKPSKESKPDFEMDGGEKPSKECKPDFEMDGGEKASKESKPDSEMDEDEMGMEEKTTEESKPEDKMDHNEVIEKKGEPSKDFIPDSKMDDEYKSIVKDDNTTSSMRGLFSFTKSTAETESESTDISREPTTKKNEGKVFESNKEGSSDLKRKHEVQNFENGFTEHPEKRSRKTDEAGDESAIERNIITKEVSVGEMSWKSKEKLEFMENNERDKTASSEVEINISLMDNLSVGETSENSRTFITPETILKEEPMEVDEENGDMVSEIPVEKSVVTKKSSHVESIEGSKENRTEKLSVGDQSLVEKGETVTEHTSVSETKNISEAEKHHLEKPLLSSFDVNNLDTGWNTKEVQQSDNVLEENESSVGLSEKQESLSKIPTPPPEDISEISLQTERSDSRVSVIQQSCEQLSKNINTSGVNESMNVHKEKGKEIYLPVDVNVSSICAEQGDCVVQKEVSSTVALSSALEEKYKFQHPNTAFQSECESSKDMNLSKVPLADTETASQFEKDKNPPCVVISNESDLTENIAVPKSPHREVEHKLTPTSDLLSCKSTQSGKGVKSLEVPDQVKFPTGENTEPVDNAQSVQPSSSLTTVSYMNSSVIEDAKVITACTITEPSKVYTVSVASTDHSEEDFTKDSKTESSEKDTLSTVSAEYSTVNSDSNIPREHSKVHTVLETFANHSKIDILNSLEQVPCIDTIDGHSKVGLVSETLTDHSKIENVSDPLADHSKVDNVSDPLADRSKVDNVSDPLADRSKVDNALNTPSDVSNFHTDESEVGVISSTPSEQTKMDVISNTQTEHSKVDIVTNNATNGVHNAGLIETGNQNALRFRGRQYLFNSALTSEHRTALSNRTFSVVSCSLKTDEPRYDQLFTELEIINPDLVCFQHVSLPYFTDILQPKMNDSGYIGVTNSPKNDLIGLATFSKSAAFHIDEHSAMSLKEIVEKEVNLSPLEPSDKEAFLSILDTSGSILFTHLSSACSQKLTVTNVAFPETDVSTHTLYVSCLAREAFSAMKGLQQPHVLCGRFNIPANGPAYQLLKDGYLSNEMIEDLQARKDVSLPGKENAALVNLLWKAFQHPSSHLRSCYSTVKGCELVIPETEPGKTKTSPNLVWFSSDSLNTVGVLDIESSLLSCGFESLKADIAFVSSCT